MSKKISQIPISFIDGIDNKLKNFLNIIYPIGHIYITIDTRNPSELLGIGVWEKVSSGRVLQGSDENHSVGTTIEAGLPNIEGQWNGVKGFGHFFYTAEGLGAFYRGDYSGANSCFSSQNDGGSYPLMFDASKSNSIYGNSTTVQPPAFVVNIWKRIS